MPLSIPPELKKITPFVKRAEELDRDKAPESRLVAYYCRQYAVQLGIGLATSAAGKECLGVLLGQLEEEKAAMSNFTREESKYLCKTFADKIFDKADAEDRAGAATKNTAKTFYAAGTFFEMLQQFNDSDEAEQEEERNKTVYSKWKATEILKAIKEGRQPTPGGYGEADNDDKEEEEEETEPEQNGTNNAENEVHVETVTEEEEESDAGTEVELLGPPPEYPTDSPQKPQLPEVFVDDRPPIAPPAMDLPPVPEIAPPPLPSPAPAPKASSTWFGTKKTTKPGRVSNAAMEDAAELTKFALSALQNKDADLAASRLRQALESLGR